MILGFSGFGGVDSDAGLRNAFEEGTTGFLLGFWGLGFRV